MFIRNAWYVAAWADEIGDTAAGTADLQRAGRAVPRPAEPRRRIVGHVLPPRRAAHIGTVVEQGLQCGYHGLIFDHTGACVHVPGQDRIIDRTRVRCFPVVEQDAFVWIWMGDPALADPTKIVSWPYHNDAVNWPHKHTMYPIKAAAMLMVDNLMDLTHLGYVHTSTIGGNPTTTSRRRWKPSARHSA